MTYFSQLFVGIFRDTILLYHPHNFRFISMDFPKISMDFPPGPGQRLRGVVGLAAADVRQRARAAAHGAELRPRLCTS